MKYILLVIVQQESDTYLKFQNLYWNFFLKNNGIIFEKIMEFTTFDMAKCV